MSIISVIGAGAWGTALAQVFAGAGHAVKIYGRDPEVIKDINTNHANRVYLPDVALHKNITACADYAETLEQAEAVVISAPAQCFREVLQKCAPHLSKTIPVINTSKGMEMATGALLSEVAAEVLPQNPYFVLSGPTFAAEVSRGLPTAVTLASKNDDVLMRKVATLLSGEMFRPYLSKDPVGAEIGGALKNVIAIACGIADGKKLGHNAKAAVMTRGMAEIRRFGLTHGAQSDTFLGLSGIGDLCLTCSSMLSRNYSLGFYFGEGQKLDDILGSRRATTEGVTTTIALTDYAKKHNIDMPIASAVNAMLHRNVCLDETIDALMARPLMMETA